ncbi:MAG: hypothetical protein QM398_13135 [Thermoproteota archaeon]|nr:hypothetical protein [Thermoproteota archaeon]
MMYYNVAVPVPFSERCGKTLRVCEVCGARIPSRNWSRRSPENKVLRCTRHLSSRNIYIRMKKKWPCMEDQ